MNTTTCENCSGRGQVYSEIAEEFYYCHHCGGQAVNPVSGETWFYKPRSRYNARPMIYHVAEQPSGDFKITGYDERGPVGHSIETARKAYGSLNGCRPAPRTAPKMLDFWSLRPAWREGMVQMEIVALFNLLSCNRFWKEASEAYGRTANETLANLQALKRQHLPTASTF